MVHLTCFVFAKFPQIFGPKHNGNNLCNCIEKAGRFFVGFFLLGFGEEGLGGPGEQISGLIH